MKIKRNLIFVLLLHFSTYIFAQGYNGNELFSLGINIEGSQNRYSKTIEKAPSSFSVLFTEANDFVDSYAPRFSAVVGYKTYSERGNYHNLHLLGGTSSWEIARIETDTNFMTNIIIDSRFVNGTANQFFTAAGYTYGIRLNKKSERFRMYVGFRGGMFYSYDDYKPIDETMFFPSYEKRFGLRSFVVPEISYLLGENVIISLGGVLPLYRASMVTIKVMNPALTERQQRQFFHDLDNFYWQKESSIELSVGWIFKKKK